MTLRPVAMQSSATSSPPSTNRVAHPPRVCIVGGGFGGLYTALYLSQKCRRQRQACEITLIEPGERFLFTPLLYEVLTDELKPWEIAPAYASLLQGTAIHHWRTTAQQLNLEARTVNLASGETLAYDYLVVATGSQERPVPVPGLADHAHRFRTLEDAQALDSRLADLEARAQTQSPAPPIQVTIVGGGPSGVELACKLADRLGPRGHLNLVERGDCLLKPFSQRVRRVATQALQRRRVQIHLNTGVVAIEPDRITLDTPQGPAAQPTDLVVWVAGTQPTPWLGASLAKTDQGQQLPQGSLQLPQFPEVFVVGDQAVMGWQRDRAAPQTAQAAYQAAATVAHNLLAAIQGRSSKPFRYLHLGDMMTLGYRNALVSSFGLVLHGPLAGLTRQIVYLQRLPTWSHRGRVAKFRLSQIWHWLCRQ